MEKIKTVTLHDEKDKSFNKAMIKIYLFKFLISFHIFSAVIIPFFTQWVKLNLFQIMLLQSWCMLWVFLSEIPKGAVADKFGRKMSMQLGIIFQMIGFSIYVLFPSFMVYLVAEMILGISISLMSGADEAFVYDTLKSFHKENQSKKIFGRVESFSLAGIMSAAPIGSFISEIWGSHMTLLLMIIPLTMSLIITFSLKEPLTTTETKNKKYMKILKEGVTAFRNDKILKILATDTVIICSVGFLLIWFYQLILLDVGVEIKYLGIVNTLFVALEIILLNSYIKIEKLLKSKKRLIFLSNITIGLLIVICVMFKIKIVIMISIIIALALAMTRRPLMASYMNRYIKSENRATVVSTISMFISFVRMVTFPIIGYIAGINLKFILVLVGIGIIIFAFYSKLEENHLE